jgi:hypothetical protein
MQTDLEKIQYSIDKMNKNQHIEIVKILKNKSVNLNENKNGCYINLTYLHADIILELQNYIEYVNDQEQALQVVELRKIDLQSELVVSSS